MSLRMLVASAATVATSAVWITGCNARYTILSVPAISMTNATFDASYRATPGPHVTAQFCSGDTPAVSEDDNVGLIDEAVMKAQKQSSATYLADAVVFRQGDCVIVEGTAMR